AKDWPGVSQTVKKDKTARDLAAQSEGIGEEARVHKAMVGNGHPNVIGLEGAIRTPDGRVGIAIEIALDVNLYEFSHETLPDAIESGQITEDQAEILRRSITKGTAKGIGHIQNNGKQHRDAKSPNMLFRLNGDPAVADFGASAIGERITLRQMF